MFIEKYQGITDIYLSNGETTLDYSNGIKLPPVLSGDFYFCPTVSFDTNTNIEAFTEQQISWGFDVNYSEVLYRKIIADNFELSIDNSGTVLLHPINKGVTLDFSGYTINAVCFINEENDEYPYTVEDVYDMRSDGGGNT